MSRPNPIILFGIILISGGIMAALPISKGAFLISAHEGDTYHLMDILFRMEMGLKPHQDFMTPLGLLSLWPILVFLKAGYGIGAAIIWSQVLVAAVMVIPVWYAAWSRLTRYTGYTFAAISMILILALTFGGTEPGLSISMHYNRWAWAVAWVLSVTALTRPRGRQWPLVDGLIYGLGFSALVLLKVTFFVALLPGVALVLILRRQTAAIAATVVTGAVVVLLVTFVFGFDFWPGYVGDLLTVSQSEIRPYPGVAFSAMISSPQSIATVIIGLLSYSFISRAGHPNAALGAVLLVPGFFFITYQNFGNDPKWLVPLAAVMMALRPAAGARVVGGVDMRTALTMTSLAAVVIFSASAFTLTMSPLRHFAQPTEIYDPMLPALPRHHDILVRKDRAYTVNAEVYLDQPSSVWGKYRKLADRSDPPTLGGVTFPHCEILAGTSAWFNEISADLVEADIPAGSQLFTTDILTSFWLFADFEPLQNGAPWYYGNLSGIENADFILVPKCSFLDRVYGIMLNELEAANLPITLVRDNELYALFSLR
ncbi:MAG: hypothetical protein ACR2O1_07720 [Boseongicola sp.]